MSHKRIIGQKLSAYRQFVTVSFKSNLKIIILNAIIMLVFATWFLIGTLNSHIKDNADFLMQLFMFSISFTIATEIKDWNEYFIRNKEYKNLNIFVKVIHVMPTFTITLLFLCVFSYFIKFVPNIPDTTANILTILMLIIYSISYTIRTIFYNNDNTKKRKMKN